MAQQPDRCIEKPRLARSAVLAAVLAGVLGSPVAAGQAQGVGQQEAAPPSHRIVLPPVLAGPEVDSDRPDRLEQGLTMEMAPMMAQVRQYPQDEVRRLLAALESDSVDASLRLTRAQRDALAEVGRSHNLAVREYRASHGDTFESLRVRAGYTADPPLRRDQITPEIAQARAEYREFVSRGPTNADLQSRLFAELTGPQQAWMNEKLSEVMLRRERSAGERRYANELAMEPVTLDDLLDEDGEVMLEKLPARLRARLERMEPGRRRIALERLMAVERPGDGRSTSGMNEAGMSGMSGMAGSAGSAPGNGSSKPPPPLDEVVVPEPSAAPVEPA